MIIHKEQQVSYDALGRETRTLIISYVNKDGGVSFLSYPIPYEQMFEWKVTSKHYADPEFVVTDANGQPVIDPNTGKPKKARWMTYDNKFIKKVETKKDLSDNRINEIINGWSEEVKNTIFAANTPITWYCDIETDVSPDGPCDANNPQMPVNTIAITRFPNTVVFSRKDLSPKERGQVQTNLQTYSDLTKDYKFDFRYYPTEHEMLEAFIDFMKPIPCVTGWNFISFDWTYIKNRCEMLGINVRRLCPTNQYAKFKFNRNFVVDAQIPMHRIIGDYMLAYIQWDQSIYPKENNKLDFVAEKACGVKKVEHEWGFDEFYRDHFMEYVFYNAVDTILVEQIDKSIKTADIWYMLAAELRIDLNDAYSTIKPAETVMTNFVYPQHKVVLKEFGGDKGEDASYEGAFVWPTQPGIYKYIGGLDFASLYPSIMRQFLISPETFLFKNPTYKPMANEIKTSSGAVYRIDQNAVIPSILTHYFGLRKKAKACRKDVDTDFENLMKAYERRFGTYD